MAEVRHAKQQAERPAHASPPLAAARQPTVEAAKPPASKPADAAKPADSDQTESAEKTPAPEDPKARALAARTAAEQALLDEARTQLESKNAVAAQATLDRMKKRFPHGTLEQERELLRVEVHEARGQTSAAKRAARKFAKAYPESPQLSQLESLLEN
jgi:hypothetical protein